jgi:hypothetical protein
LKQCRHEGAADSFFAPFLSQFHRLLSLPIEADGQRRNSTSGCTLRKKRVSEIDLSWHQRLVDIVALESTPMSKHRDWCPVRLQAAGTLTLRAIPEELWIVLPASLLTVSGHKGTIRVN